MPSQHQNEPLRMHIQNNARNVASDTDKYCNYGPVGNSNSLSGDAARDVIT